MYDEVLLRDLLKNTEVEYSKNCNVELVNLNITYSKTFNSLDVLGELKGEPNRCGILVITSFVTDTETLEEKNKVDSVMSVFPGIDSFCCSLNIPDALIVCKAIKIEIKRRDENEFYSIYCREN